MRRGLLGLLAPLSAALAGAATASAGDLPKPYFAATKPGTWTRYESKSPQVEGTTVYTYVRLPDDGGRVVISLRVDFPTGPYRGTWSKTTYVTKAGFDAAADLINFLSVIEGSTYEMPGQAPMKEQDETTLEAIRLAVSNYEGAFSPKGSASVDGRACDQFTYKAPSKGPNPTVDTGEIWLDSTLPFGIVRQVGTITNKQGEVMSKYDMRLLAHGTGEPPPIGSEGKAAAGPAPPAPPPEPTPKKATGRAGIGE